MSTQPILNQRCDLCGGILAHNANKTEYTCIRCGAIIYKQITSSDPNAAYDAKVLEVAEKITKVPFNPKKWNDPEYFPKEWKESIIQLRIEHAKAMVAEMKYLVIDTLSPYCSQEEVTRVLIERGLTPAIPNTKTDDNAR